MCESNDLLAIDSKAVEQFMTGLALANDKVIKLYGECESLDDVFKNKAI